MRKVINFQMQIGETDISTFEFDLKPRDEIPKERQTKSPPWETLRVEWEQF